MATRIVPGHKVNFRIGKGTRQGIVLEVTGTHTVVREYYDNGIHRTHTLLITQLHDPH